MKAFRALASLTIAAALTGLVACSSGGGSSTLTTPPVTNPGPSNPPPTNPPPTNPPPTNSPPPPSTTISSPPISVSGQIVAAPGGVNGSTSWYAGGTTAWSSNSGDTSAGGNGSNTIDGVSCSQMSEPASGKLHVHAFVGLYVNGSEEALPSAVGMKNPAQPATASQSVQSASCFYHLHTHDYSGLVHIEDDTVAQNNAIGPTSYAKLKTLFDIWGEPINANTVATASGSVAIYIGTPSAPTASNGAEIVHTYAPFNGDLTTIKLGHHQAIWIVVGTPPAALPQVLFGIES